MRIQDQNIQLQSQHQLLQQRQSERVHETFINGQLATRESMTFSHTQQSTKTLTIQPSALENYQRQLSALHPLSLQNTQGLNNLQQVDGPTTASQTQLPTKLQEMISAIEAMMERLTGKKVKLQVYGYNTSPQESNDTSSFSPQQAKNLQNPQASIQNATPTTGQRWLWNQIFHEEEHTRFQATGHVTTEDGRAIDFNLTSSMSRQFTQQFSLEKQQGVIFKDPLVINFNGQPATLTVDKFAFDLDADGQSENISFVNNNSGFLAFDKNQDGVINDGTELFGAMTGNGFAELSQFDEDANGWIDENDTIFSQLQVWQKTPNGLNQLSGLLELNIGAIYLQNIPTEFALNDSNKQHGQIRSSGVFLHESGQVGTIQQIDLVV
ncbi:hypothetical protein THMIRHAM_09550 [Thiomicrorhabdus immobilis]|uniref:VCBS repeat-containing protein n=1 Tax=Thiomicrorhabdus immobilis TaxID=2791037 RepID=A0ABM7MCS5_9GAMM|nr:hypothetical protein [Thiomicrorhabdus immobilis]BCN93170.1 hypothetical protein THMIRHAM_09550 [Thiomicrorhabdus immobilis]